MNKQNDDSKGMEQGSDPLTQVEKLVEKVSNSIHDDLQDHQYLKRKLRKLEGERDEMAKERAELWIENEHLLAERREIDKRSNEQVENANRIISELRDELDEKERIIVGRSIMLTEITGQQKALNENHKREILELKQQSAANEEVYVQTIKELMALLPKDTDGQQSVA